VEDFEKLGSFYLGKRVDDESAELQDELILYDSKDLTTHGVIIGMTGSGKTGLGIGLIEEAAMDSIPVIAIDPKGDLGNLLLTFPDLAASDFEPWVDPREAAEQGQDRAEYAADTAKLWKNGLKEWGQSGERIRKMRETVDLTIYTPGSSAGTPLSILQAFDAPSAALMDDADLYRERLQATATSLLSLLSIDADPVTSREHILITNLLDRVWREGRGLDLAGLIATIQQPPMDKIGVLDLDSFFPAKDRFGLAMRLNNLLAAPGFEAWMQGEPLDAGKLLYTDAGKPRVSVLSIAHLNDNERMFFVSMVLNSLISWMRAQPGTGSLRAILYMDEIFGYMPPIANPPSKQLLLTLLKQARAFGVGLTLSTQNPVDLDYKGLSNTGTWFIGRLQTERDKARVMEGLSGIDGGDFDLKRMEETITSLGKRRFVLHNVHEDQPVVFNTRWAMSYLAGPLTRDQIKALSADKPAPVVAAAPKVAAPAAVKKPVQQAPVLPPTIKQYYLPSMAEENVVYYPLVFGAADVVYSSARYKIENDARFLLATEVSDGPVPLDWDDAEELEFEIDELESKGLSGMGYSDCPKAAAKASNYKKWNSQLKRWLRSNRTITLYKCASLKLTSGFGETEGEFRVRLQQHGNELRDLKVAKLRKRYGSKTNTLEERYRKAMQAVEREKDQQKRQKLDVAVSFGTALLGAVMGRRRTRSWGSAVRRASNMGKEAGDVQRAEETVRAVAAQLQELQIEFQNEVDNLELFDAQLEELDEITVKPKSTDITVHVTGLLWRPYVQDGSSLEPAWE
jgi:hypothetical protein